MAATTWIRWTGGAALCVLLLSAAPAMAGAITYKDGHVETVKSILSESDDAVWVVRADHQLVKLDKKNIVKIAMAEDQQAEYEKKAAALASDNYAGHLKLAQWCFDQLLDGAGRRELRLAAAGGDTANLRATLKLAMMKGETTAARTSLRCLRAASPDDAWLARVAGTIEALAQLEEQETAARATQAQQTALVSRDMNEVAALNNAINNPFQMVTHEDRTPCPRCWGTGRVTTVSNSLPQGLDQQHLLSVNSVGDGAYNTYTVPLVVTCICPQCQGRKYIVTTATTRERINTTAQQKRRDEVQKSLDEATAARNRATAELNQLEAKRKKLTADLLAESAAAPPAAN